MAGTAEIANEAKLLSSLGLCVRAGKVIFGVPMIVEAMRRGGRGAPVIVLEASDTSENTHKRITDKCTHYGVEHLRLLTDGATLASALGKTGSLGAVAVCDGGMRRMLDSHLKKA